MSPFEADIGYIPRSPVDVAFDEIRTGEVGATYAQRLLEERITRYQQLQDNIQSAQERMKRYYDKNRPTQHFSIGDEV